LQFVTNDIVKLASEIYQNSSPPPLQQNDCFSNGSSCALHLVLPIHNTIHHRNIELKVVMQLLVMLMKIEYV